MRTSATLAALLSLCCSASSPARASSFDEATGKLSLEGAAFAISFDDAASIPEDFHPEFTSHTGGLTTAGYFKSPGVLEGSGALSFGGQAIGGKLDLAPLTAQLTGRRIELRLWQLPQGTRAKVSLVWGLGDLEPGADPGAGLLLGLVPLQPTGRATDDGWLELSSGPLDFAAGGVHGPALLVLEDLQLGLSGDDMAYATSDETARVLIDALEISDLGPALVPTSACTVLDEATACGAEGLCLYGRCVDGAIVAGPVPQSQAVRDDYLSRRLTEYQLYEGGRIPQQHMPQLSAALDVLRQSPTAARFWPGIKVGIEKLWDGHATPPMMSPSPWVATNLGVCLHLGHADLLPTGGTAPLVFERTEDSPLAPTLEEGDALVAIDAEPPLVWASQAARLVRYNGDPAGYQVLAAPALLKAALQTGATLTFHRCPHGGPSPAACTPAEIEEITVDLASLLGTAVWQGELPSWVAEDLDCDFRFRRDVNHPDVRTYSFAGYANDGPIRTLLINGVPAWDEGGPGQQWFYTVAAALDPPPSHLIVDQRQGRGGTVSAVDFLIALLLLPSDFDRMLLVPWFDRELDDELWALLLQCGGSPWQTDQCGGFWQWRLGSLVDIGNAEGVAGSARVAVLNAFDASGNDFTSKLFTYRSAATRIFAPAPTYGAFGPIVSLPYHLHETFGGSVQINDTIFRQKPGDPLGEFQTGIGVAPDEVVYQRQSDAVQGIDTVVARAKEWLLEVQP